MKNQNLKTSKRVFTIISRIALVAMICLVFFATTSMYNVASLPVEEQADKVFSAYQLFASAVVCLLIYGGLRELITDARIEDLKDRVRELEKFAGIKYEEE